MKAIKSKQYILSFLAVFIMSFLSFAFHHQDASFQLATCAICKSKNSILSVQFKPNIDWDYADLFALFLLAINFIFYAFIAFFSIFFPYSERFLVFPNRAPPEYFVLTPR